jgi:heptosyltransferase-2
LLSLITHSNYQNPQKLFNLIFILIKNMLKKTFLTFASLLFILRNKKIPKNPKKILIIRSGSIGDVLMTTPLIRAIRQKYKKAYISYLVGEWSREVLAHNKNIDEIISFDEQIIFNYNLYEINKLKNYIQRKKFDLCFILDKSYHWNLFAYLCKIPFRIGFDRRGEGFRNNLNVKFEGKKSELEYYLGIAKLLGINIRSKKMDLFLSKNDKEFSNIFIKSHNLKNKKIIGIAPGGAENPGDKRHIKRWPREKYIELIKRIINKNNTILLFGGKNDSKLCDGIMNYINNNFIKKANNIINLAGKTTIQQSAALINKCKLFITHDSGTMHIAATTKTKLVVLFGPTDPKRFAPKNTIVIQSNLDCCPCYDIYGNYKKCKKDCMGAINVEEVCNRVKKFI